MREIVDALVPFGFVVEEWSVGEWSVGIDDCSVRHNGMRWELASHWGSNPTTFSVYSIRNGKDRRELSSVTPAVAVEFIKFQCGLPNVYHLLEST